MFYASMFQNSKEDVFVLGNEKNYGDHEYVTVEPIVCVVV